MSAKERGLGRGLEALLGEAAAAKNEETGHGPMTAAVGDLVPGPFQPRRRFDQSELEALADSIRRYGIMQPILVRADPDRPGGYQIVAGERRWRAAQLAKLHEVPIAVRDLEDRDALEIALIENVQREDLSALEEAEGYRCLIDQFGGTQEELAQAVGKSRSHIANTLRLLSLPEPVQKWIEEGALSAGHGRALLAAPDPVALAKKVAAKGLNVRQTEHLVRRALQPKQARSKGKSADVTQLEHDLTDALGLKISIADRGERGEIRIAYDSLEQLDFVIERLRANPVSVIQLPER
jgi:ParB family chromosome partitioning protein